MKLRQPGQRLSKSGAVFGVERRLFERTGWRGGHGMWAPSVGDHCRVDGHPTTYYRDREPSRRAGRTNRCPHGSWADVLAASGTGALGNRRSVRLRFELPLFAPPAIRWLELRVWRSNRRAPYAPISTFRHRAGPQVGHHDINPTDVRSASLSPTDFSFPPGVRRRRSPALDRAWRGC